LLLGCEPMPVPGSPEAARLIRTQHEDLRLLLGRADRLARCALRGDLDSARPLITAVVRVRETLLAHLEDEEALLPPARVARLRGEHEAQRAAADTLTRMASGDAAEMARGLRAFAATLLEDMRQEEAEGDAPWFNPAPSSALPLIRP